MARRQRFADIRVTRNRRAASRSLAPASIKSADLGQLAQMAGRVHVQGFHAGADTDTILRQRDLRDTRNGFDTMRTTRGPALLTGRTHP